MTESKAPGDWEKWIGVGLLSTEYLLLKVGFWENPTPTTWVMSPGFSSMMEPI